VSDEGFFPHISPEIRDVRLYVLYMQRILYCPVAEVKPEQPTLLSSKKIKTKACSIEVLS
jgi:hypothetical protein